MFGPRKNETALLHVLRLVARAASVVCLAIIFLFFLGEDFAFGKLTATEWLGFIFFPVGVLVGLVLAWQEELIGGFITVLSVVGFYFAYGLLAGGAMEQGWALLPFLVPGFLFLFYGFETAASKKDLTQDDDE